MKCCFCSSVSVADVKFPVAGVSKKRTLGHTVKIGSVRSGILQRKARGHPRRRANPAVEVGDLWKDLRNDLDTTTANTNDSDLFAG